MPYSFQISQKYLITLGILCSNMIHIMLVTYFQIQNNFLDGQFESSTIPINSIYYGIAILTTIGYPMIVKKLGLKFTLMTALVFDMISLALLWASISLGGVLPLIFISTVFLGFSLITVAITNISYFVLEFPKKLGVSLMAVFAFGDAGVITANLLSDTFSSIQFNEGFFLVMAFLYSGLIFFIYTKFTEPPFPKHLEHLRKGSLIWKEFHFRLGFFMIAAIGYGIVETIFAVWGEIYLIQFMTESLAVYTISLFWFAMLLGQIILLLPLYYFPMRQILPPLIIAVVLILIFIQSQTHFLGFITGFSIAGFACAAILPIIIASMERELITASFLSHQQNYLPYVEIGTALLMGSYYIGIGGMNLYVLTVRHAKELHAENFFHWAVLITALMGLITMFLNWSSPPSDQTQ